MLSPRELAAARPLVRLYEGRLAATPWGRFARVCSVAIAAGASLAVVALRASDGPRAATEGVVRASAIGALWLVGVTAALAASQRRAQADRRDGVDALALAHGAANGTLSTLRGLAAFGFTARWMLLPIVTVALASLGASGTLAMAAKRAVALTLLPLFALAVAAALSALATLSDRLAPRRGRSLLLAILFVSAAVAEASHIRELSVIGALRALLGGLLATARSL